MFFQDFLRKKTAICLVWSGKMSTFATLFGVKARRKAYMVAIVQLVRASDCGSECRGFESH